MYLRLAFSVAINMNPDVLLADEVLAVGDLEFQERCLNRVAEASRQGITVLFVSHDMAAISRLCTRAVMLNSGELVKDGSTDEIVELYQEAAWTRGRRRPRNARNEIGELLFVKLTSPDGREVGAARWAEDVCITYGFRIDQAGVFVRPTCDLFARGVLAFRALEPQELHVTQPGFYTASLRLPAGLLAETVYSVNAAIDVRLPDDSYRPIADPNALTFRVYDVTESSRGSWKGKMPGVVAPRLEWTTTRDRREEKLSV
jgi:lipopolysaccharide transport system ATP-binding protein